MRENQVQPSAVASKGIQQLRRKEVVRPPRSLRIESPKSIMQDLKVEMQTWIEYDCKRALARPNRTALLTIAAVAVLAVAVATCRPTSCIAKQAKAPVDQCKESVATVSPGVSLEPFTRPIVATSGSQ